ncbi:MAG: TonB-dependent receptor [Paludibacter sp.]|nr:TonB-dependent receptor [Paludibacter sp.]
MKKELISLFIFIVISLTAFAQEYKVSGTIISDDDKMPIIGANVVVKGTSKGTITDSNGQFTIEVQKNKSLLFSYIGYLNEEQKITNNISNLKITLKTNSVVLDEVVAVGYGTVKKSDLTGAVASVSGEQLRKLPAASIDKALQGLTPGVTVVANSGQPGSDMVIRIRGIGTTNDASPLFVVDGVMVGNINFLSPNDIKSVEVLKDASSSAIYGARGANGVILVTTNQGNRSGKMTLSVDAYYGVQNRAKKLSLMNSDQLSKFWGYTGTSSKDFNDWVFTNFSKAKPYIPTGLDFSNVNTDWQDVVFTGNAPIQNYHVAANGGTEKTSYSISAGYFDQSGIIMTSYFKRFTFRVNSSAQVNDWLKVGENMSLMTSDSRGGNPNSDQSSLLNSAIRFAPWDRPYYPAGVALGSDIVDPYWVAASTITNYVNPISMTVFDHPSNQFDRLVGDAYLEIKPFKDLVYKADFGIDLSYGRNREFKEAYKVSPTDFFQPTNFITEGFQRYQTWSVEQTLTYSKVIGKHNFSAMVGSSVSEYMFNSLGGSKVGIAYPTPDNWYISMATGDPTKTTLGDGVGRDRLASFLGRVNYSYNNRYLFTANFRADGSTKFPVNNLWGYFPSFSLGWKASEEEFFAPLRSTIDILKVRAGWGQIGNEKINGNNFFPKVTQGIEFVTYAFGTGDQQLANGGTMTSLPTKNLKWETTEQSNIGIDFGMCRNRLTGSMDYYIKDTKDMLLSVVLPEHLGIEFPSPANVGQVRNSGFELLLNWRDKITKNLNFSVGGNLATVKNKFTKMGASSPLVYENFNGETLTRSIEGYPLYSFYGYTSDGIYQNQSEIDNNVVRDASGKVGLYQYGADGKPFHDANGNLVADPNGKQVQITIPGIMAPGDIRYKDLNGDGLITDKDKKILGSSFPTFTYGFNASLDYKGFDISLFFQGVSGNMIYNCNRVILEGQVAKATNLSTAMADSWSVTNPSTTMPRPFGNTANYWASDRFLEDGSYLRLKNAQIGYNLPKKILAPAKIESCRLYVSGTNLLTFTKYTGYDPEASYSGVDRGNYPQAVTILFGVKMDL